MKFKIFKILCFLGLHRYTEYSTYIKSNVKTKLLRRYVLDFRKYKYCECCNKVIEYDGFIDNWKSRKLNQLPLKIRREIKLKNIKNI